ncbi:DUF305 domain-containing protein [Streptomyces spectabilis]|uniref:Uncharacterized protein (DUF305 family) n=1 Tax=Streptomyces spectabilis TaxID=68270 RepID=A0A7W8ERY9_STRST|nr:DUF305 domain-containing protein [Streptomyces spectabilis]MBB5101891.1 uncharacterized protein (DUF305 family) [Streptomyces spectabilis]MCI3906943.1 DUF305 domain-containing protein [Streptomyces spectabilis]
MPHRRTPAARTTVARASAATALLAAATLALGACDSDSASGPKAKSGSSSGPSVIAPGKPGETAATLSAEEAAKERTDDDSPNSADFDYVEKMIPHHAQALEMTRLVPKRAKSTKVKRLADRITAAQKPEIGAMERWLKSQGKKAEKRGHGAHHDHAGMPGMATPAQLEQLRAAKGEAFDELFLKLMITHHSGAVTMATDALSEGNNLLVEEMANDVVAQQTAEINRMRGMG